MLAGFVCPIPDRKGLLHCRANLGRVHQWFWWRLLRVRLLVVHKSHSVQTKKVGHLHMAPKSRALLITSRVCGDVTCIVFEFNDPEHSGSGFGRKLHDLLLEAGIFKVKEGFATHVFTWGGLQRR
jgi:hypothetical protein